MEPFIFAMEMLLLVSKIPKTAILVNLKPKHNTKKLMKQQEKAPLNLQLVF